MAITDRKTGDATMAEAVRPTTDQIEELRGNLQACSEALSEAQEALERAEGWLDDARGPLNDSESEELLECSSALMPVGIDDIIEDARRANESVIAAITALDEAENDADPFAEDDDDPFDEEGEDEEESDDDDEDAAAAQEASP